MEIGKKVYSRSLKKKNSFAEWKKDYTPECPSGLLVYETVIWLEGKRKVIYIYGFQILCC